MILHDPFNDYVTTQSARNGLVVQPRMGFSDWQRMRDGLVAVKNSGLPVIGTLTLDAMTRQGLAEKARIAVAKGEALNGYPLASYSREQNRALLDGVMSDEFIVQVRHGTPMPRHVFDAAINAGLFAIEGGPVSYALPYGRALLRDTFPAWRIALRQWAAYGRAQRRASHMESFAGCMMGQLCPPSLLIALGILEGLFIRDQGIASLSLSLAQGTHSDQDIGALQALARLMKEYLPDMNSHIVAYTWMGVFPDTAQGAEKLIKESARAATIGGASRLIVKTVNEAIGIPTVEHNLQALRWSSEVARACIGLKPNATQMAHRDNIYTEAKRMIDCVGALDASIETALQMAFKQGLLDVPFCLHPDNANIARAVLAPDGCIGWAAVGKMPIEANVRRASVAMSSDDLLQSLSFNSDKYNQAA